MTEDEKKMVYNLIHLYKTTLDAFSKSVDMSGVRRREVIGKIQKSSVLALNSFITFFDLDMDEFERYIEYVETDLDNKQKMKNEKL